jgi:hypothetical protein
MGKIRILVADDHAIVRVGLVTLLGRVPDFEIVGEAGKAAVVKSEARAARSTGSGATGGGVLSPSQKKDLDAWNESHPEMKMTAKEFLER